MLFTCLHKSCRWNRLQKHTDGGWVEGWSIQILGNSTFWGTLIFSLFLFFFFEQELSFLIFKTPTHLFHLLPSLLGTCSINFLISFAFSNSLSILSITNGYLHSSISDLLQNFALYYGIFFLISLIPGLLKVEPIIFSQPPVLPQ